MNKTKAQKFLGPSQLEEQEHLSRNRLSNLHATLMTDKELEDSRPRHSFADLMRWVERNFASELKGFARTNLKRYVHNRIIMDGQFMAFCEERKVEVNCLYQDSIISWKTENNFEKFFVQGVFCIRVGSLEFLHAALFHKGNQNEDEVSFFVIVSDSNYQAYVKFRNEFDSWVQERDRSNLRIHVMGGEDLAYTKDNSWEDLFLPDTIKNEIKGLTENFLASQEFYRENRIPWKRGFLLYGEPGNGKTSIIRTIISEYDFKPVTISPGADDNAVREAFSYAEEQSPSLLYFEDLDSLLETSVNSSTFLNLMDGISAKNGLLIIATANNVKKLKSNITKRPSRFDRKWEIPLPTLEMAYIYLKRWFKNSFSNDKLKQLAKTAIKNELSYAYLKDLYITSMFEALAHNRKAPTEKDVDHTLTLLIKDKNLLNNGEEINTDKYFK